MPPKASSSAAGSRSAKAGAAAVAAASGGSSSLLSRNHSRDKLSLCAHIVAEHFGPVAGRVASVLLTRGRLSVPDLLRFLGSTSLSGSGAPNPLKSRKVDTGGISQRVIDSTLNAVSDYSGGAGSSSSANAQEAGTAGPSGSAGASSAPAFSSRQHPLAHPSGPLRKKLQIQHALMVLVQHNVCFHVRLDARGSMLNQSAGTTADAEALAAGTEYFEMNPNAILPRLRLGDYIGLAEDVHGELGKEIVLLLLQHGKYEAGAIIDELGGEDRAKRLRVEALLKSLLWSTYVLPSTLTAHISRREREIAYEKEIRERDYRGQVDSPKLRKELFAAVSLRIQSEDREAVFGAEGDAYNGTRHGLTLKSGASGSSKRRNKDSSAAAVNGDKAGKGKGKAASSRKGSAADKTNGKGKAAAGKKGKRAADSSDEEEEDDYEHRVGRGKTIELSDDELDTPSPPIVTQNLDDYDLDVSVLALWARFPESPRERAHTPRRSDLTARNFPPSQLRPL